MATYNKFSTYEEDRTDNRNPGNRRCVNCGHTFHDHYNGQCPNDDPVEVVATDRTTPKEI